MRQADVYWLSFPYSDLGGEKHRPALVISNDGYNRQGDDIFVCAITTNLSKRPFSVPLEPKDFSEGSLPLPSRVRCDKIMSVEKGLLYKKAGRVSDAKFGQVGRQLALLIAR